MPDTVSRASMMTSSGSFSKCPRCLLLGQRLRPPDESDPGSKSSQSGRQEKRFGKSSFMCSMHSPWEITGSQPGRPRYQDSQKDSCRRHPTSGPRSHTEANRIWQQRPTESGIGLGPAIYQPLDLRCSSTSQCLSYFICEM